MAGTIGKTVLNLVGEPGVFLPDGAERGRRGIEAQKRCHAAGPWEAELRSESFIAFEGTSERFQRRVRTIGLAGAALKLLWGFEHVCRACACVVQHRMGASELYNAVTSVMTPLEIFGALTALISVWLTVRRHIACWPIGMVSSLVYVEVMRESALYADMVLQVFFFGMGIYGWLSWGRPSKKFPVTKVSQFPLVGGALFFLVGTFGWRCLLLSYTDAALPALDSATAVASLVAQWWMTRKHVECWPLWIAIDAILVGVFLYKSLYPTAVVYAVFLVLAAGGWREWRAAMARGEPI